jgi:hypothetical protein
VYQNSKIHFLLFFIQYSLHNYSDLLCKPQSFKTLVFYALHIGIKINLALPQKNIEKMNFATNENKSIS